MWSSAVAQLYNEYLATGGPDGEPLPASATRSPLLANRVKFCGLLNSLGEQSFAEDSDMTIHESVRRKKEGYRARKFGTVDNRVLTGLERTEGGEQKDRPRADVRTMKVRSFETSNRRGWP